MSPRNVLFLCTGNSCRSQMAEGFAKQLKGDPLNAYSAGTKPQVLNRLAIEAMKEIGIDISGQHAKHIDDLKGIPFDYVVTVCDNAQSQCPLWLEPGKVLHQPFDDPPALAANARSDEEALVYYRRVRDQIGEFVRTWANTIEGAKP